MMGKSDDKAVINEAKRRFQCHLNGDLIDPNIREAVYAICSRYGDESTQEELRKLYKAADMTEEKVRLLRAMGQSVDPNIIEKTLQFIFESDDVRMQDSPLGLVGCTSSRIGRDIAWKFLQNDWLKLAERFGEKSRFLIRFCEVNLIEEKLISVKIYSVENLNFYINHEAFVEINWNSQ
ncbi:unnamed protein product [Rotaria sp. Silwood2]|nr:unnamed protein product [Rotaria sp. Silwood2]CAF3179213.1 unnamed protein product [Rotaria sp. Silwood2]CAF4195355.1 unnamed protein product [Rotaria sp. Silwood2]CAF4384938.1 unnamed protein product [Rotaria sp. Silwood2]